MFTLLVFLFLLPIPLYGVIPQYEHAPLGFSGYIKPELFVDSRLVEGEQDDQSLDFPLPICRDKQGKDINKTGLLDMVAIETNMSNKLRGPCILGAQSFGTVAVDFWGTNDFNLNSMRLLFAYIDLLWQKRQLFLGQMPSPMHVDECFPTTIGYDSGSPIEPFAYVPQIRYIEKFQHADLNIALSTEMSHYVSNGPVGYSSIYLRESMVPIGNVQLKGEFGPHIAGVGVDVRSLKPRIVTDKDFKAHERITSVCAFTYVRFKLQPHAVLKMKLLFTQNPVGYGDLGGYGIQSVDPVTDNRTYTNLNGMNFWTEFIMGKEVLFGIFAGFYKNLGSMHHLVDYHLIPGTKSFNDVVYGFGPTINWWFAIQPRVQWKIKNLEFAGEVQYTYASFGNLNQKGQIEHVKPVGDFRVELASYFRW